MAHVALASALTNPDALAVESKPILIMTGKKIMLLVLHKNITNNAGGATAELTN